MVYCHLSVILKNILLACTASIVLWCWYSPLSWLLEPEKIWTRLCFTCFGKFYQFYVYLNIIRTFKDSSLLVNQLGHGRE